MKGLSDKVPCLFNLVAFPIPKWLIEIAERENQDGGVCRHTEPPHTTRTDRKSNGKEVRHQGNKKKHSSRPVGGAETGTGVEKTRVGVAGPRLAECGTNGAGNLATGRPCGPTFAHR